MLGHWTREHSSLHCRCFREPSVVPPSNEPDLQCCSPLHQEYLVLATDFHHVVGVTSSPVCTTGFFDFFMEVLKSGVRQCFALN
jgi:hypothetical protein